MDGPHQPEAIDRDPRRLRPAAIDIFLAACLVGLSLLTAAVAVGSDVEGDAGPDTWWGWALVVIPSTAVAFRRTAPLVATPITIIGQMLIWALGLAGMEAAPLVMIYSVVAEGGRRGRFIGLGATVALSATALVGLVTAPDVDIDIFALTVLASVIVFLLGHNAATQRAAAAGLASELTATRLGRDAERERVVAAERQRIARELHDLVGHTLSVIVVRAEAAGRVADRKPEAAVDALAAIGETARSSLGEVRRVLYALRSSREESELAPLSTVADIETLVARTGESAGIETTCQIAAPAVSDDVTATVGAGAFRIVQEALTNVIKHAGPGARAQVEIEVEAGSDGQTGDLVVRVSDDGRGVTAARPTNSTGSGIAGMTERAAVLGGTLDAGPRPGGGFRVVATLPLGTDEEGGGSR